MSAHGNKMMVSCTLRDWAQVQMDRQLVNTFVVAQASDLIDEVARCGVPELALGRLNVLRGNDEFNRLVEIVDRALERLSASYASGNDLQHVLVKNVELGVQLLVLKLKSGEAVFNGHAVAACATSAKEGSQ
jgi:hypothetical protein